MKISVFFSIILSIALSTGCDTDIELNGAGGRVAIPVGLPDIDYPEDNEHSPDRWLLGRKLFYDPILSADSSISCNSCHKQELAFADDLPQSAGVGGLKGNRNAPSLGNVAYQPYFTREGGVPTLEMQVLVPIQEHDEMAFNIVEAARRLERNEHYVSMSQKAYDRTPDAFVITRALACFERSLITGDSPYDQFVFQNKKRALNRSEERGMELFMSDKTNCSQCHSGFNFTNYAFENNGLYENYADSGRMRLTNLELDRARFKVPSLRNVGITAPYMHNGSIASLSQVVEHYNSGGKNHKNKSKFIKPLNLSDKEIEDLIAFLNALTDESFVNNSYLAE